jgi:hypothetical protein
VTSVLFSGEFSPFFDKEIGIILEAIFFQGVNSTNFAKSFGLNLANVSIWK